MRIAVNNLTIKLITMKKKISLFVSIIAFSTKLFSQLVPNGQPIYEDGKIYLQIRMTSSVVIQNKDTILNDAGGSLLALFNKYQVTRVQQPFKIFNDAGLNKNYKISFFSISKVDSLIIELTQLNTIVDYAEKVPLFRTCVVPNDPLSVQNGIFQPTSYHLSLLKADQASNIHQSTGNSTVAIVDDAILTYHDDLLGNIGTVNTGSDVANQDNDPNPPLTGTYNISTNFYTHGTKVAGVAGAVTNNNTGIASIGQNNRLMCVKSTSDNITNALTDEWAGLAWASMNGAKVINMSWGSPIATITEYSVTLLAKAQGAVLVASAGNSANNIPLYPAAYGEGVSGIAGEIIDKRLVVAVAALDQNNNSSYWFPGSGTSYGQWVDISAYGTNILTTVPTAISGTAITNTYGLFNGTSAAAPMIAGIAGLMRSYNTNKTADQIIDCLIYTANPDIYGSNHPANQIGTLGSGRADAEAALRCISSDCSKSPIAIIVPSSPSLCANTTITLTANQANSYTWSTGANTQTISVNTPGVYSVAISHPWISTPCIATTAITFSAAPTLSLNLTTNTTICTGKSLNLVSASGNYNSLLWKPGGLVTNSIVVSHSGFITYSVTANQYCGGITQTIGVAPITGSQLPNNVYAVIGSSLAGSYNPNSTFFYGHYLVSSDAIINSFTSFHQSKFLIGSNVKISIPSSSTLNVNYSHLSSCGTDMWKGIVLSDGSKLRLEEQTMIEDAVTAVSSTHTPLYSSGLVAAMVDAENTVFNKNFIDISLTNYYDFFTSALSYTNSLKIKNCFFTCRNFAAGWVTTGIAGTYTVPNNLISPHTIPSSTVTLLKTPYSNQISSSAIQLNSVGVTTNNAFYSVKIGDDSNLYPFNITYNLFDTHHKFIEATNSNVILRNNVFQNSTGPAVESVFSSTLGMKGLLDLAAPNSSVTNKFWDCKQAVSGNRVYKFDMLRAVVRSTQNSTNTANSALRFGVTLKSGRFDYLISQNEFTNIYDAVNISVIPIQINSGTFTSSFIDAQDIIITSNTINSGSVSGSFSNRAINVSSLFNIPWTNASSCNYTYSSTYGGAVSNHCRGLTIDGNNINGAFRGIAVNGVSNFQTNIQGNNITLNDDNIFNAPQQGINLVNSMSGVNKPMQFQITQNSISGGSSSISNPLMSMVFSGNNMGIYSPSISCNELQNSHKGFVFNGANSNAVWAGNVMQPLTQGLRLENAAVIGTQGGPSLVNANQWQGTWTGDHTFVDGAATNATNSVLWVKATAALNPTNNSGPASSQNYGTGNNSIRNGSLAAEFNCIGIPNAIVIPLPNTSDFNDDTQDEYYIQQTALYRFLHFNDSLRLADVGGDLDTYYSSMSGSNIDKFLQVEQLLYAGDYNGARDLLDPIEPAENHPVETNYKNFYALCANYLDANETLSETDSTALYQLAELCPGTNGACVYQARALYNALFGLELNYEACGEASGNRAANNVSIEQLSLKEENNQTNIKLFPNPATNKLIIFGGKANEVITIDIKEVSGRNVLQKTIQVKSKGYELDLNLINGIYFVTLIDSENKVLNEKLIIAK